MSGAPRLQGALIAALVALVIALAGVLSLGRAL